MKLDASIDFHDEAPHDLIRKQPTLVACFDHITSLRPGKLHEQLHQHGPTTGLLAASNTVTVAAANTCVQYCFHASSGLVVLDTLPVAI